MKLRSSINNIGGVCIATIDLDPDRPLSGLEIDALSARGDPVVDFGGTFTDVSLGLTFTLATAERSVPSCFPVQMRWDFADYDDAPSRAVLWALSMETRIGNAMGQLVLNIPPESTRVTTVGAATEPEEVLPTNNAALAGWLGLA